MRVSIAASLPEFEALGSECAAFWCRYRILTSSTEGVFIGTKAAFHRVTNANLKPKRRLFLIKPRQVVERFRKSAKRNRIVQLSRNRELSRSQKIIEQKAGCNVSQLGFKDIVTA